MSAPNHLLPNQGPDVNLREALQQPVVLATLALFAGLCVAELKNILTAPGAPFGPTRKPATVQVDPVEDRLHPAHTERFSQVPVTQRNSVE